MINNRAPDTTTTAAKERSTTLYSERMIKLLLTLFFSAYLVWSLENGLARTPPMGWMSWERFRCITDCKTDPDNCIGEKLYMQMADKLVEEGYKDLGYEYVNIDDCWMSKERDSQGRLQADPERFPSGIKALADYIHAKGLKMGIYEDFGTETCGGYPGSEFYLQQDAQTFAQWGVDMLKLDGCYANINNMPYGYPIMEFFMNHTGRPMLYSCSWPAYVVFDNKIPDYEAIAKSCNIWRNYADIQDSWASVKDIITFYAKDVGNFSDVARPGQFNDPDMIIVGNFGLSYEQQRSQMALWAIMAAPLLMSNDLRKMAPESKALLQNKNVISINQDKLGIAGKCILNFNQLQMWMRQIEPKGSIAFAVLYTGDSGTPKKLSLQCQSLGMVASVGYNITEVFTGSHVGFFKPQDTLNITVNPSGVYFGKAVYMG